MILGISMIGVCEAFALAEGSAFAPGTVRCGLDLFGPVLVPHQLLPGPRPVPNSQRTATTNPVSPLP